MILNFEERLSDSPFVERIWRTQSEEAGSFISIGLSHWQMAIWTQNGKTYLTLRGPETKASEAYCPPDAAFLGIVFKAGTVMPNLPASSLVDRALTLPDGAFSTFWLDGSAWQFPTYENADTFINRLAQSGLLIKEPVVDAALQGQIEGVSLRSVQRRFVQTTGITHNVIRQIERARYATVLLKEGRSILDTVYEAGYFDQPHLNRALKQFIGQTPTQLMGKQESTGLSFLYKTAPRLPDYDQTIRISGGETQCENLLHQRS